MPERRGSAMYDPARDIFTASDEAVPETQNDSPSAGIKRKRSYSSPEQNYSAENTKITQAQLHDELNGDDADSLHASKRSKASSEELLAKDAAPVPVTAAKLSQIPRAKKASGTHNQAGARRPERSPMNRTRSRSPARQPPEERRRERRRTPPRRRTPSPKPIRRTPSPPARSPPRQRKRPGAAARISAAETEAIRRRQQEREQEEQNKAQAQAVARGVHDVVRQHYNAVPQRGREWRKTGSLIKGLRSLNNWIKAAIVQKFSPSEDFTPGARATGAGNRYNEDRGLLVLDIGCGKGGDLQKWQAAPQRVALYVGLDPADISIEQARERYREMQKGGRGGHRDRHSNRLYQAEFVIKDCYGEWIGDLPIVQEVGIDPSVGPNGTGVSARWGGGGFDVVTMMFCMHYAFESEAKARGMLRNVAGALKKGGRFIGVIPNSDVLTARVVEYNAKHGVTESKQGGNEPTDDEDNDDWDPEKTLDLPVPAADSHSTTKEETTTAANGTNIDKTTATGPPALEFGNSIYRVKFPGRVPADGVFRPPFGWKYFYFLEEAVEEIPEYVVPWEAFRALAVEYDLELQYRRPFSEVWEAEKEDSVLGPLSERMGVKDRDGRLLVSKDEVEAAEFYLAFCFYKT